MGNNVLDFGIKMDAVKRKILIGVPSSRHYEKFFSSLHSFIKDCSLKYDINLIFTINQPLNIAQNYISEEFLNGNYDYLLFLDDDHWGHKKEMLDCLIDANSYMATIKSYSRHYPYFCALMRKHGDIYAGIENGEGYQECALTGFPMTLLRRDLFKKLEKPFFRARNDGGRDWATDREFCERLASIGIRPMGCFQYCLPHDEITEENVKDKRFAHRNEDNLGQRVLMNYRKKEMAYAKVD